MHAVVIKSLSMSHIISKLLSSYLSKIWIVVLNLILIPLYLKYLGIEAYALIGLYAILQSIFVIFDMGFSVSINREISRLTAAQGNEQKIQDLTKSFEVLYWGFALVLGFIILFSSRYIAYSWLKVDHIPLAVVNFSIIIIGISLAFQFPIGFYAGCFMGLQRQVLYNAVNTAMWTVRGLVSILIILFTENRIIYFFCWQLVTNIANVFIFASIIHSILPKAQKKPSFNFKRIAETWRFAIGTGLAAIIILLFNQADKIILSKMLNLTYFGYYTLTYQVIGSLSILYYPIYSVFFPMFSQNVSQHNDEKLKYNFHLSSLIMAVLVLPTVVWLFVFSKDIMFCWTGSLATAQNTYILVQILICGAVFSNYIYIPNTLHQAFGHFKYLISVYILGIIFLIPMLILVQEFYGIIASAFIVAAMNIIVATIFYIITFSKFLKGEVFKWLYNQTQPLLSALIFSVVVRYMYPRIDSLFYILVVYIAMMIFTTFTNGFIRNKMMKMFKKLIYEKCVMAKG